MNSVNERIASSWRVRAADLIAELNTESCGLLAAAATLRCPVIDPKLPVPRAGMIPQPAPTCAVVDAGREFSSGSGGDPVGDAVGAGVVPSQPAAASAIRPVAAIAAALRRYLTLHNPARPGSR
jgi:hypothetical protein